MATGIRIGQEVLGVFPRLRAFSLAVHGLDGCAGLAELAARRLEDAAAGLRAALPTNEALVALPAVAQWREAYKAMGVKASAYRCSFEALARRAIAGKPLATGVAAVDLYNAASLAHRACLGAYDLDRLADAPIDVRFCAGPEDVFSPLGGRAEDMPLRPELVVYAQGNEVLCWALNHRDSEKAALQPHSRAVLFVAEGVTQEHAAHARSALEALRGDLLGLGATVSELNEVAGG